MSFSPLVLFISYFHVSSQASMTALSCSFNGLAFQVVSNVRHSDGLQHASVGITAWIRSGRPDVVMKRTNSVVLMRRVVLMIYGPFSEASGRVLSLPRRCGRPVRAVSVQGRSQI
ncbi:hypothetical protein VTK26DRAFT_4391 [Humicola hyalothermophila]